MANSRKTANPNNNTDIQFSQITRQPYHEDKKPPHAHTFMPSIIRVSFFDGNNLNLLYREVLMLHIRSKATEITYEKQDCVSVHFKINI